MSGPEAHSRVWLRPALWTALFRHAVPVLGVLFLDWQALDVLLFLFVETWLFLTLRVGTEVVLNRSFGQVPETGAYSIRARFQSDNRPQSDKLYLKVGA